MNKTEYSPNGQHKLELKFKYEIPFGPVSYEITIDNVKIDGFNFDDSFCWSENSSFLALSNWIVLERDKKPTMQLMIIDLIKYKISAVSKISNGFIKPKYFDDQLIIFEKSYADGSGKVAELEINLNSIKNWVYL